MLSVYLPLLPLEALRPCWSERGPYAVVDRGIVLTLSHEAACAGVRHGMHSSGVAAVAPETVILERARNQEDLALEAITTSLMQFTPDITFQADFSVLLDISASLRLFRGAHALSLRVMNTIKALGFTSHVGTAPTSEGAWLFAHSSRMKGLPLRRRVLSMASMHKRLNLLPCGLLPETAPFHDWLNDVGARRLGALRQLPRAGLLRRTNKGLLVALDRAYGDEPEMHEWIKPPLHFSARVETFDRVEHADALLHGATRLILQLVGWLVSLQQSVRVLTLYLEHERGRAAVPPTEIEIALAEPVWHEAHLVRLLKERLSKVELERPVIALRLDAVKIEAMLPQNDSLFPEPGGSPQDYARLLELLTARLGPEGILVPAYVDDYRPEVCNTWVPANTKRPKADMEILDGRPFWLLPKPIKLLMRDDRPFYGGSPLKFISSPERLEAGWWDDQTAARDYVVAQGADATCYWIYFERIKEDARWFLHGLFA